VKIAETKGFSLIELLVVTAIMGITAIMGSFAWNRYYNNANLRMAARQVMVDINKTKSKAVAKMDTTFTMTFTTTSYTTYPDNIKLTTVMTRQLSEFGPGITFEDWPNKTSTGTITFLARGTLSPTSGDIILTNNRGSNADVTFNQTGKTYVKFKMQ